MVRDIFLPLVDDKRVRLRGYLFRGRHHVIISLRTVQDKLEHELSHKKEHAFVSLQDKQSTFFLLSEIQLDCLVGVEIIERTRFKFTPPNVLHIVQSLFVQVGRVTHACFQK